MKQLLIFLAVITFNNTINGQTNIGGTLTKDTKLSLAGSPYSVNSNLGVPTGITLTIESGVILNFNGSSQLIVQGTLTAKGTANNSVTFNGKGGLMFQKTNLSLSSLEFIKLNNSIINLNGGTDTLIGNLNIPYLEATNSEFIINGYNKGFGNVNLTNANLNQTKFSASFNPYAVVNINNSKINGGQYIFARSAILTNDTISNASLNHSGSNELNLSKSILVNTVVTNNAKFNMYDCALYNSFINTANSLISIENCIFNSDVNNKNNTIIRAGRGIIRYCEFNGSGVILAIESGGINYSNTDSFIVSHSNFNGFNEYFKFSYTTYNPKPDRIKINNCNFMDKQNSFYIYNKMNYTINAKNNYWGTTSDSIIDTRIVDYWDDILTGIVEYKPKKNERINSESYIQIASVYTDPVHILPKNLLKIITNVSISGYGELINHSYRIKNDTIYIESCYGRTFGYKPATVKDTLEIGNLKSGDYVICFKANISSEKVNCISINSDLKIFPLKVNTLTFEPQSILIKNNVTGLNTQIISQILINGNAKLLSSSKLIINGTIFITNCYYSDVESPPFLKSDTINVGVLDLEKYVVQVISNLSSDENNCTIINSKTLYKEFTIRKTRIEINSITVNPKLPKPKEVFKITADLTMMSSTYNLNQVQELIGDTLFLKTCYFDDGRLTEININNEYSLSIQKGGKYVIKLTIINTEKLDNCIAAKMQTRFAELEISPDGTTKINEIGNPHSVYPNPFSNSITIQNLFVNKLSIYNSLGQKLEEKLVNKPNETIELGSLSNGIFWVYLQLRDGTVIREKLIKCD